MGSGNADKDRSPANLPQGMWSTFLGDQTISDTSLVTLLLSSCQQNLAFSVQ